MIFSNEPKVSISRSASSGLPWLCACWTVFYGCLCVY